MGQCRTPRFEAIDQIPAACGIGPWNRLAWCRMAKSRFAPQPTGWGKAARGRRDHLRDVDPVTLDAAAWHGEQLPITR